jgi:hypothetical protein
MMQRLRLLFQRYEQMLKLGFSTPYEELAEHLSAVLRESIILSS